MNPKPFSELKNLTVPVVKTDSSLQRTAPVEPPISGSLRGCARCPRNLNDTDRFVALVHLTQVDELACVGLPAGHRSRSGSGRGPLAPGLSGVSIRVVVTALGEGLLGDQALPHPGLGLRLRCRH